MVRSFGEAEVGASAILAEVELETVAIERNQTLIAQIMPSRRSMSAAQALSGLQMPMLTPAQANAWLTDSMSNFDEELRDPWA